MKTFVTALAMLAAIALPVAGNAATQCRNAQGHFVKCPTTAAPATKAAPAAHATPAPHASSSPHATASHSTAPSAGHRCRNAKGQFAKCGTPGAKPA